MAGGGDNNDTLTKGRNRRDTGLNVRDVLRPRAGEGDHPNGGVLDYRAGGLGEAAARAARPARPDAD